MLLFSLHTSWRRQGFPTQEDAELVPPANAGDGWMIPLEDRVSRAHISCENLNEIVRRYVPGEDLEWAFRELKAVRSALESMREPYQSSAQNEGSLTDYCRSPGKEISCSMLSPHDRLEEEDLAPRSERNSCELSPTPRSLTPTNHDHGHCAEEGAEAQLIYPREKRKSTPLDLERLNSQLGSLAAARLTASGERQGSRLTASSERQVSTELTDSTLMPVAVALHLCAAQYNIWDVGYFEAEVQREVCAALELPAAEVQVLCSHHSARVTVLAVGGCAPATLAARLVSLIHHSAVHEPPSRSLAQLVERAEVQGPVSRPVCAALVCSQVAAAGLIRQLLSAQQLVASLAHMSEQGGRVAADTQEGDDTSDDFASAGSELSQEFEPSSISAHERGAECGAPAPCAGVPRRGGAADLILAPPVRLAAALGEAGTPAHHYAG